MPRFSLLFQGALWGGLVELYCMREVDMCCPTRNGCGCFCGSNTQEGGAVGGEGTQSPVTIAQELGSIALIVRGVCFSGGDWVGLFDSLRNWECQRLGCCEPCMQALVNCFCYCGGNNGAISREDLHDVLVRSSLEFGITTLCLALDRLSSELGKICHKPKEDVESILKSACEKAFADIKRTEEQLILCEADESSLTDPTLRDPVRLCSLIQRVCASVGLVDVITQPPIHSDDDRDSSNSGSR